MSYSEWSHLGHHVAASDRGSSHTQISRVQSVKKREWVLDAVYRFWKLSTGRVRSPSSSVHYML